MSVPTVIRRSPHVAVKPFASREDLIRALARQQHADYHANVANVNPATARKLRKLEREDRMLTDRRFARGNGYVSQCESAAMYRNFGWSVEAE